MTGVAPSGSPRCAAPRHHPGPGRCPHGHPPGPRVRHRARQARHHRAAHPRRLLKPSAAAWRSSLTSATSGSPSPNPAPKQPDRPATATRQKLAAKGQPPGTPLEHKAALWAHSRYFPMPPYPAKRQAGGRPLTADDDYSHRHCRQPHAIGIACGKTRRSPIISDEHVG